MIYPTRAEVQAKSNVIMTQDFLSHRMGILIFLSLYVVNAGLE